MKVYTGATPIFDELGIEESSCLNAFRVSSSRFCNLVKLIPPSHKAVFAGGSLTAKKMG